MVRDHAVHAAVEEALHLLLVVGRVGIHGQSMSVGLGHQLRRDERVEYAEALFSQGEGS